MATTPTRVIGNGPCRTCMKESDIWRNKCVKCLVTKELPEPQEMYQLIPLMMNSMTDQIKSPIIKARAYDRLLKVIMRTSQNSVLEIPQNVSFDFNQTVEIDDPEMLERCMLLIRMVDTIRAKLYLAMCTRSLRILQHVVGSLLEAEKNNEHRFMAFKNLLVCAVCYDQVGATSVMTSCGHLFCSGCISRAMDISQACPSCRQQITTTVPCGALVQQFSDVSDANFNDKSRVADIILGEIFPKIKMVPPEVIQYLIDVSKDNLKPESILSVLNIAVQTQSSGLLEIALELQQKSHLGKMDVIQLCEVIYASKHELLSEFILVILRYLENNNQIISANQCTTHESLFFLRSYRRHIAYLNRHAQYTTNNSVA